MVWLPWEEPHKNGVTTMPMKCPYKVCRQIDRETERLIAIYNPQTLQEGVQQNAKFTKWSFDMLYTEHISRTYLLTEV